MTKSTTRRPEHYHSDANLLKICSIDNKLLLMISVREIIDNFYLKNGQCCAGCDWWRFHNSLVGECIKSAPVSSDERLSIIGIENHSLNIGAGHILTPREHYCGYFIDTYDWKNHYFKR